jgi:hypothetical protein
MSNSEIEKCWKEIDAEIKAGKLREDRARHDDRRRAQFQAGWKAANKRGYTQRTLKVLHWNNLGYRFGKYFGRRDEHEVKEAYEYLAAKHDADVNGLVRIVKIAPGESKADFWDECKNGGYICVGWNEVGDLREFNSFEQFKKSFVKTCGHYHNNRLPTLSKKAKELWTLMELEPGDKVIANNGTSKVRAIGTVRGRGYEWNPKATLHHTVTVKWDTSYACQIPPQHWFDTVEPVSPKLYSLITDAPIPKRWTVLTEAELEDERKRIEVSIADRQGQQAFRRELFKVYGTHCAVSGCEVVEALAAAHIHQHTGPKSNDAGNGIVLRSDIHLLFDQCLLAINPHSLKIVVRRSLEGTEYWKFDGQNLKLSDHARSRLSVPMLEFRYRQYKAG